MAYAVGLEMIDPEKRDTWERWLAGADLRAEGRAQRRALITAAGGEMG